MRFRRSSVALLLALCASCVPGATVKPPHAPVRGELVPVLGSHAAPTIDEPLRVVFASPRNQAAEAPEITVVFNQPLRHVGDAPPGGATPIVVRPAVPGKTSWVGTTALRFVPDAPFAKASTYSVEIPKGLTSAAGKVLEETFQFSFTTEKPTITGSEPENKSRSVATDAPMTLYINQQVSAAEVLRTVTITANKKPVPFDVAEVEKDHVVLKPRAALPRDTDVVVRVDGSLKGAEGEATLGEAKEIAFHTLGPFVLSTVQCAPHPSDKGACDPNQNELKLRVTNLLAADMWEQAIFVQPTLDSFGVYESGEEENGTWGLTLNGSFEPGKTYTVGIRPKAGGNPLVDAHGQSVGPQKTFTLRFGDLPSEVTFGADGIYWPPGKHSLPVGVLNTPEATVTMVPLRREEVLERLLGRTAPPAALTGAKQRVFKGGKPNEATWDRFVVEDLLPASTTKGPMVARGSYLEPGRSEPQVVEREMQVTNIGLLTKVSPEDAIVWATAFSDGSALAGAKVDLYALPKKGKATLVSSSKADAGGLAFLPVRLGPVRPENLAVFVERGDDWAYQTLSTPPIADPVGLVFTGRGIYRPGENMAIKGLVRLPITTGLVTPKVGDVTLRLLDTDRHEVARMQTKLTKFGTFSAEMPVPVDGQLGFYQLRADVAGGQLRTRVTVDEYRPIESKAFAKIDKESYIAGEKLTCQARGEQLYGAPMVGADVKVVMTRTSGYYDVPGFESFLIGTQDYFAPVATVHQASGKLDAHGTFSTSISTALPGQITTETISCQIQILDINQRGQIADESARVHPTDVYVAFARPEEMWLDPGTTIAPRVVVVTPKGEIRAAPVHIEMVYRTEKEDRSIEERSLAACDVTTGKTPVGCSFVIPKQDPAAGDLIIIRGTTTDSQNRRAVSVYSHRINSLPTPATPPAATNSASPPPPPPPPPPPVEDPPRLKVELEHELHVGQTAHVTMTSPYSKPAKALLTFEREGIIMQRAVELAPHPKNTVVEVPITAAMMPIIMAKVTTIMNNEVQSEHSTVGIDAKPRQLSVDVRLGKKQTTPGDTVDVDVTVKDASGKPAGGAEVTLWAEDEGSLMVSYYNTPNPWYALYAERDFLVDTQDAREHLLSTWTGRHRVKPPSVRMGATSVSPHRGDFRQSVAFFPNLVTDAAGHVKQKITLPDGLTAYRFMAMAVTEDDRSGAADATVQTSKPFMAKPTLPRVVRVGDEFEASVVLSTMDRGPGKATVEAKVQGFSATGPMRKVANIGVDGPMEVKFPLRADRAGKTSFSVDGSFVSGAKEDTDAVDLKAQVVAPMPFERAIVSGETPGAIAEKIAMLPGIRTDVGGLAITVSPSSLSGMATALEQLVEYPYGCTEQTVSRLVPLLVLRDLSDAFQVPLVLAGEQRLSSKNIPSVLQQAVDRVVANQSQDGGFGLWPTSSESQPWVTAYALWGLSEAERRGVLVPKDALDRAVKALEPAIDRIHAAPNSAYYEQAAFSLDVLATIGRKNEPKMKALFERQKDLSTESRALLLHAYVTGAPEARAEIAELSVEIANAIRLTPTGAYVERSKWEKNFGSDVMATALALRGLLAFDSKHPLAPALAAYLMEARRGGNYATTHDAAWALLALDTYRRTLPPPTQAFDARVFLGNTLVKDVHFQGKPLEGQTFRIPMADVAKSSGGPLTFQVLGQGRLHYDVMLEYARDSLPTDAVEAGFFVTKSMRRVSEYGDSTSVVIEKEPSFAVGEVVVCEVEVVSPAARSFVVVEDPIPGGFEPLSFDYREAGAWLRKLETSSADRREKRDDKMVYFVDALPAGISRFRYLARAMHTGRFVAPPTRAEQMYDPSMFGSTPAMHVRVHGVTKR